MPKHLAGERAKDLRIERESRHEAVMNSYDYSQAGASAGGYRGGGQGATAPRQAKPRGYATGYGGADDRTQADTRTVGTRRDGWCAPMLPFFQTKLKVFWTL